MLRGEKEKKDVTNVDTHTDRQTDTQTEKDVNPTSRYSTGFSIMAAAVHCKYTNICQHFSKHGSDVSPPNLLQHHFSQIKEEL